MRYTGTNQLDNVTVCALAPQLDTASHQPLLGNHWLPVQRPTRLPDDNQCWQQSTTKTSVDGQIIPPMCEAMESTSIHDRQSSEIVLSTSKENVLSYPVHKQADKN